LERQPSKHVRTHTHDLKPLNHFTVVPYSLSPLRFNTQRLVRGVRGVHPGGLQVSVPVDLDPEGAVGHRRVVRDAVHGISLAVGLRPTKGARCPQRGVLGRGLGGRARGADDVRDVFTAVLPVHVQERRRAVRGPADHKRPPSSPGRPRRSPPPTYRPSGGRAPAW